MRLPLLLLIVLVSNAAHSQDFFDLPIQIEQGKSLIEFIDAVESKSNLKFFYLEEWLEPFAISADLQRGSPREVLTQLLKETDIGFVFLYNYAVIFYKDPTKEMLRNEMKQNALNDQLNVDENEIGSSKSFVPGTRITLRGTVTDKESNSPIPGVAVQLSDLDIGSQL